MRVYPSKILLAWSEAIGGNEEIAKWLFHNGYQELICVIDFLHGSTKAGKWLMDNKFPELRAFAEYLGDEDNNARHWLLANKFDILTAIADAVHEKKEAMGFLQAQKMPEMILLASKFNKLLYQIEFDTNLIYRSPI